MGCKQCKRIPAIRVAKEELNDVKPSERESVTITQVIPRGTKNSKQYPVVTYRNPAAIRKNLVNKPDLVVESIIQSEPEEVPQHLERTDSDTPVGSTESFDFQDTATKGISSKPHVPNPLNNTIVRQIPIDTDELPTFQEKLLKFGTMDAIVSYISDDDIVNAALTEPARSYSVYGGLSSSMVDPKDIARRTDTVARITSPKSNRFEIQQDATHKDLWNESNVSYSLRDSFISMESANSDKPVGRRKAAPKIIFVRSKKSKTRQKPNANKTSSESDDLDLYPAKCGSSTSKDLRAMKRNLQTILKSTTSKLSNPDIHQKASFSETSCESNEL